LLSFTDDHQQSRLHVEGLVVLERWEPGDAEVLVLVEESLYSDLSSSLGVLSWSLLPLVELHVIAKEHVDAATFEVSQDPFLLLRNEVRTRLDQIYVNVLQIVCELTKRLMQVLVVVNLPAVCRTS
jgi:hypothetical protein